MALVYSLWAQFSIFIILDAYYIESSSGLAGKEKNVLHRSLLRMNDINLHKDGCNLTADRGKPQSLRVPTERADRGKPQSLRVPTERADRGKPQSLRVPTERADRGKLQSLRVPALFSFFLDTSLLLCVFLCLLLFIVPVFGIKQDTIDGIADGAIDQIMGL